MILAIYILVFIFTWLLAKFLEVKFLKPSDREDKWDAFKAKILFSFFSWLGFMAAIVVTIILLFEVVSEDRDPPKWL